MHILSWTNVTYFFVNFLNKSKQMNYQLLTNPEQTVNRFSIVIPKSYHWLIVKGFCSSNNTKMCVCCYIIVARHHVLLVEAALWGAGWIPLGIRLRPYYLQGSPHLGRGFCPDNPVWCCGGAGRTFGQKENQYDCEHQRTCFILYWGAWAGLRSDVRWSFIHLSLNDGFSRGPFFINTTTYIIRLELH